MAISPAERDGTSHDTEALYREHGAAVAALCRSLLRDRAETEDATQQVFLSAHRALLNGAAPREPRAWLLAVARNECYARFRERASTPTPTGDAPEAATADASVHVLRAGELANVWDEVGRMPATQREAFLLREIRGLSYGQVADELSLSGPSVRSLLLRARLRLRQRLGDVAAGLAGVPWVQALLRLFASGDAASPVPVATKAAAVGIGALALAGGGGLVAHHGARSAHHATGHHRAPVRVHHVAQASVASVASVASLEDRPRLDNRGSDDRGSQDRGAEVERSHGRDGSSRDSGEGGRDRASGSSGESSSGSSGDGSDDTAVVTQGASNGSGGGGSTSSGPGSGDGSGGGSSSGSGDDGSDGGSGAVTTATSSGSSSGSSDSSGSNGSGGGGGSGDDGSTH